MFTLVIACFEMQPQILNTLTSVMPSHQRGIDDDELHVVVVDNGSQEAIPADRLPPGVEYRHIRSDDAAPYPGPAINEAVRDAPGPLVGVMVDGARLLTPGTIRGALDVLARWPAAVVDARGWHLGHQAQQDTLAAGGDPHEDQQLLADVEWPDDGYRLFDICAPTFSTRRGFLGRANESTAIFLSKDLYLGVGGYDERFTTVGGGLANIDLWWRLTAVARPVVTLLGEGTFHQAHGGASTGLPRPRLSKEFAAWRREYEQLTGRQDVGPPPHEPLLIGRLGRAAERVQAAALQEDVA